MEPIPENPVNTTADNNQQRGGAGAAAVPYAVIQDVEQVARRRICVVANAIGHLWQSVQRFGCVSCGDLFHFNGP